MTLIQFILIAGVVVFQFISTLILASSPARTFDKYSHSVLTSCSIATLFIIILLGADIGGFV